MSTKRQKDEFGRLNAIPVLEVDPHPDKTGVLLSDEIIFYVGECHLIKPFSRKRLKPASYQLTVGDEAMVGGRPRRLGDCWPNNSLSIPAFEVAVIKTDETLNLPRFLIGRWNIRVALAYQGLVWVGGPQVDPGYVGHLFCPIYNLSDKEVRIKKGDAIAVIDFVKTTGFDTNKGEEKWERYQRPPKRVVIEDYGIDDFRSGPFETKDKLDDINQKMNVFTSLVFVILAILMSAIGLPYLVGDKNIQSDIRALDILTFWFSLFAAILSLVNWLVRLRSKAVLLSAIIIATIGISVAVTIYFKILFFPDDHIPWFF